MTILRTAAAVIVTAVVALTAFFYIHAHLYVHHESKAVSWSYDTPSSLLVRIWHLTHRSSVTVGGYRVPVPSEWYPEKVPQHPNVIRIVRVVDNEVTSSILVSSSPERSFDEWHEHLRAFPYWTIVQEKEINAPDFSWLCVELTLDNTVGHIVDCRDKTEPLEVKVSSDEPANKLSQSFYPLLRRITRER